MLTFNDHIYDSLTDRMSRANPIVPDPIKDCFSQYGARFTSMVCLPEGWVR